jgi:hypothetical protein
MVHTTSPLLWDTHYEHIKIHITQKMNSFSNASNYIYLKMPDIQKAKEEGAHSNPFLKASPMHASSSQN